MKSSLFVEREKCYVTWHLVLDFRRAELFGFPQGPTGLAGQGSGEKGLVLHWRMGD